MFIAQTRNFTVHTCKRGSPTYHAKPDISHFENSVDQDQLASEKPVDLDLHCFLMLLVDTC